MHKIIYFCELYSHNSHKKYYCKNNRIYSRYADGYLNAEDICTLATNPSTLEAQISMVTKFTEENFLKLNASKCEIVVSKMLPQN